MVHCDVPYCTLDSITWNRTATAHLCVEHNEDENTARSLILMGLVVVTGMTSLDVTDNTASIAASATTIVRTVTGRGSMHLVFKGDGNSNVTMKIKIDGGAATSIKTADIECEVDYAFTTSLEIDAVNGDGAGAHPSSTVSTTGLYK